MRLREVFLRRGTTGPGTLSRQVQRALVPQLDRSTSGARPKGVVPPKGGQHSPNHYS